MVHVIHLKPCKTKLVAIGNYTLGNFGCISRCSDNFRLRRQVGCQLGHLGEEMKVRNLCLERDKYKLLMSRLGSGLAPADQFAPSAPEGKWLVNPETYISSPLCEAGVPVLYHSTISHTGNEYGKFLANFPDIRRRTFPLCTPHCVQHFIKITDPPIYARARRSPQDTLALVKAKFLKNGSHGNHTLLK